MKKAWSEQDAVDPKGNSGSFNILGAIQSLRSASKPLFAQLNLLGQLVNIEWAEEKSRLCRMLMLSAFGFTCFICLMIFLGIFIIVLSWNTRYLLLSIIGLCAIYGLGVYVAWKRLMNLATQPQQLFASSRKELGEDIALIVSKLT